MKANIIRNVLKLHNKSLADIARDLKISPQHLNNIFTSNDVKMGTLLKIVKVSKIPLVFFLDACDDVHDSDDTFKEVFEMYENWHKAKLTIGIIK